MFNWINAVIDNKMVSGVFAVLTCIAYCLTLFITFRAMSEFGMTANISLIGIALVVSEAVAFDWLETH